jgi:hypothetical protein
VGLGLGLGLGLGRRAGCGTERVTRPSAMAVAVWKAVKKPAIT